MARKRGQEGTVLVEIWLNQEGQQSQLNILQSSGINSLDQAALNAAQTWQFEPYYVAGHKTQSRVQIPIEFALR